MYFPSLNRLDEFGVDPLIINKLDSWLGALTGLKRNGIRPARFSVDMGIDFNLSNEIFTLVALKTNILSINYEIYCPNDPQELVKVVHDLDNIPGLINCPECDQIFSPYDNDEYILITFNLKEYPDPDSPKNIKSKPRNENYKRIKPTKKQQSALTLPTFMSNPVSRDEIDKTLFKPDWDNYDVAYDRFLLSLKNNVSTKEKGDALEDLSCILLSFITIFQVDPTIKTLTNQLDISVFIKPYLKYIEVPLLTVLNRRLICECKNEDNNVPSAWVDKLAGVIDKTDNTKAGIIFSYKKFSGDEWKFAKASQIEYARLKKYIININKEDFDYIKNNRPNFFYFLDQRFHELEMRIATKGT
ncbi:hypothetical protein M3610_23310 [Neobacillus sp. MER 74]|uniref:hypothetical protein n=1 Tax=Neobacillus sp. MER 74 TaxID=2939566 RepID=UPI00204107EB|nr:hypothetical protein [Neobacillus sp. MER 74]MCM3118160.1 hypothetical protein [Neobacillus sp. MER 74]